MSEVAHSPNASDRQAAADLLPLVYDELRKLAAARLGREGPGVTIQPTALVHEVYLRLIGPADAPRWDDARHFFAAAAEAMRRILVESARRRKTAKRGGDRHQYELEGQWVAAPEPGDDLVAIDEALDHLTALDPVKAEVVKLRYFVGFTFEQTAEALGISVATAKRHWVYSRVWLFQHISGAPPRRVKTIPDFRDTIRAPISH